ncbi:MAG: SDR family NAD(P)-dependent oxidoreductase [Thermodesulfobacteriota bacterium]
METRSIDFTGKTALVTGGSRGLGLAIAAALAGRGAQVGICGRKQENLDAAVRELDSRGLKVFAQSAHLGKTAQVDALFKAVRNSFGRLDILINNVGMNLPTPSVAELDEGLWDKIIEGNLKSAFLASRRAVALMKGQGGGRIVNISSIAARKAAPGMGVYCVAKAGLEMFTRVLAKEVAVAKISVNAVAPGMIRTRFSKPFWENQDLLSDLTAAIPMGRIAETGDVVGAVLFLCSSWAEYITGEVVTVDGGAMA